MNTEADFLAALKASPGDELLVGAFADFLEESADPRAAFVRYGLATHFRLRRQVTASPGSLSAELRRDLVADARRSGVRDEAVLSLFLAALADADAAVRAEASMALADYRPAADAELRPLYRALGDGHLRVREFAKRALRAARTDDELEAVFLSGLAHADPAERRRALASLAALETANALAHLSAALTDGDLSVRTAAVESLRRWTDKTAALPAMRLALKDSSPALRSVAATFVEEHRPVLTDAVLAPLLRAAATPNLLHRVDALRAMSQGTARGREAIELRGRAWAEYGRALVAALPAISDGRAPVEAGRAILADLQRFAFAGVAEVIGPLRELVGIGGAAHPDRATRLAALECLAAFAPPQDFASVYPALMAAEPYLAACSLVPPRFYSKPLPAGAGTELLRLRRRLRQEPQAFAAPQPFGESLTQGLLRYLSHAPVTDADIEQLVADLADPRHWADAVPPLMCLGRRAAKAAVALLAIIADGRAGASATPMMAFLAVADDAARDRLADLVATTAPWAGCLDAVPRDSSSAWLLPALRARATTEGMRGRRRFDRLIRDIEGDAT